MIITEKSFLSMIDNKNLLPSSKHKNKSTHSAPVFYAEDISKDFFVAIRCAYENNISSLLSSKWKTQHDEIELSMKEFAKSQDFSVYEPFANQKSLKLFLQYILFDRFIIYSNEVYHQIHIWDFDLIRNGYARSFSRDRDWNSRPNPITLDFNDGEYFYFLQKCIRLLAEQPSTQTIHPNLLCSLIDNKSRKDFIEAFSELISKKYRDKIGYELWVADTVYRWSARLFEGYEAKGLTFRFGADNLILRSKKSITGIADCASAIGMPIAKIRFSDGFDAAISKRMMTFATHLNLIDSKNMSIDWNSAKSLFSELNFASFGYLLTVQNLKSCIENGSSSRFLATHNIEGNEITFWDLVLFYHLCKFIDPQNAFECSLIKITAKDLHYYEFFSQCIKLSKETKRWWVPDEKIKSNLRKEPIKWFLEERLSDTYLFQTKHLPGICTYFKPDDCKEPHWQLYFTFLDIVASDNFFEELKDFGKSIEAPLRRSPNIDQISQAFLCSTFPYLQNNPEDFKPLVADISSRCASSSDKDSLVTQYMLNFFCCINNEGAIPLPDSSPSDNDNSSQSLSELDFVNIPPDITNVVAGNCTLKEISEENILPFSICGADVIDNEHSTILQPRLNNQKLAVAIAKLYIKGMFFNRLYLAKPTRYPMRHMNRPFGQESIFTALSRLLGVKSESICFKLSHTAHNRISLLQKNLERQFAKLLTLDTERFGIILATSEHYDRFTSDEVQKIHNKILDGTFYYHSLVVLNKILGRANIAFDGDDFLFLMGNERSRFLSSENIQCLHQIYETYPKVSQPFLAAETIREIIDFCESNNQLGIYCKLLTPIERLLGNEECQALRKKYREPFSNRYTCKYYQCKKLREIFKRHFKYYAKAFPDGNTEFSESVRNAILSEVRAFRPSSFDTAKSFLEESFGKIVELNFETSDMLEISATSSTGDTESILEIDDPIGKSNPIFWSLYPFTEIPNITKFLEKFGGSFAIEIEKHFWTPPHGKPIPEYSVRLWHIDRIYGAFKDKANTKNYSSYEFRDEFSINFTKTTGARLGRFLEMVLEGRTIFYDSHMVFILETPEPQIYRDFRKAVSKRIKSFDPNLMNRNNLKRFSDTLFIGPRSNVRCNIGCEQIFIHDSPPL